MTTFTSRRNWLKKTGLLSLAGSLVVEELAAFPNKIRTTADGFIHLDKNENPYGVSPKALTAMQEALSDGNRYMTSMVLDEFIGKLAKRENLSPSNFLTTAGSIEVLGLMSVYAARQKGSVVCPYPTFHSLPHAVQELGMELINVPVKGDLMIDLEAMKKSVKADTRLVYLCNPNNPTGTALDIKVLRDFVAEVSQKTMVMIDEAYFEFLNESVADMVKTNKNVLVSRTFSKVYGFAGLRVGYLIGHSDTLNDMYKYQAAGSLGTSVVAMRGAIAALDDKAFLDMYLQKNREAANYTLKALNDIGIKAVPTNANFIMFPITTFKGDFKANMKAKNILLRSGDIKNVAGIEWGRVSVGTLDEMKAFIDAIKQV